MKKGHIILGQYIGIGVLTAVSIIGALGVSLIPNEYVGFLGIVPIYLGIKAYFEHKKERMDQTNAGQQEAQDHDNNKLEEPTSMQESHIIPVMKGFVNPSVVKVASVTIANGGDNIGIYIPLFTSMNFIDIMITVAVFILLIGLWCFIGLRLAEYPFVQKNIEINKHVFIPIIFIGLGIFILIESGTITYIYKKVLSGWL
jgi:cadmium resistance transport/sequestration family protein